MNLSPRWIETLVDAGFQAAVHWSGVGKAGAPDLEIADYAAANGFVILTNDIFMEHPAPGGRIFTQQRAPYRCAHKRCAHESSFLKIPILKLGFFCPDPLPEFRGRRR